MRALATHVSANLLLEACPSGLWDRFAKPAVESPGGSNPPVSAVAIAQWLERQNVTLDMPVRLRLVTSGAGMVSGEIPERVSFFCSPRNTCPDCCHGLMDRAASSYEADPGSIPG